jgi:hypothetical protein
MGKTKTLAQSATLNMKKLLLIIAIGGISLLTGCFSIDMEVAFYEDERWEYSGEVSFPLTTVEMFGGVEALEQYLRSEVVDPFPQLNVSFSREDRDQDIVFFVTAQGESWAMLNDFAFDGQADITRQNGEIHIQASFQPETSMFVSSLTLRGGRVLDSNADRVIDGRAIWERPSGTIWVTLTDKKPGDGLVVPLVVIFGLLVSGVAAFTYLKKRAGPAAGMACAQCGTASSFGDKFCQNCGGRL